MKIVKPIFILGHPRSGTSILYKLFTRHKDTAFPEHFMDKYYLSEWKFGLIPLMVKQQEIRYHIRSNPHEGKFWQKFYPFGTYLDESDVNDEVRKYIQKVIETQLKSLHGKRFVNKQIDFCLRIRFLNKLFPDAFYINIYREPKAVVSSLYRMMEKDWVNESHDIYLHGYKGWDTIKECYGKDVSDFETCLNYYKFFINSLKKDIPIIRENTIDLKYEDFVQNPRTKLKEMLEFTGLKWYKELENKIPEVLDLNNNEKWKTLPKDYQKILMEEFGTCDY